MSPSREFFQFIGLLTDRLSTWFDIDQWLEEPLFPITVFLSLCMVSFVLYIIRRVLFYGRFS